MSPASYRGSVFLADPDVLLYQGDALDVLSAFDDDYVDCCVTSPPYWGLRDYGQEGQLGLEPTPEQYVERMVEVFREVRRVLAAHGTVWLNLGDSYATSPKGNPDALSPSLNGDGRAQRESSKHRGQRSTIVSGLKPKDLVGIPWRVAFALQADGWYLRSDIIWAKPNPMPESVTDRPTKAHEYVFLLSKQPRYFFDQEAVREKAEWARWGDQTNGKHQGSESAAGWIQSKTRAQLRAERTPDEPTRHGLDPGSRPSDVGNGLTGRNIRSVWDIATQPYPEAHFATFPEELARRCIAAGCPEFVCKTCGFVRERITGREQQPQAYEDRKYDTSDPKFATKRNMGGRYQAQLDANPLKTLGFTHCAHSTIAANLRPGIVLDPFMGSGTVAFVARKLGRHAVGIDLNAEYLKLAARRLQQQSLFAEPVA